MLAFSYAVTALQLSTVYHERIAAKTTICAGMASASSRRGPPTEVNASVTSKPAWIRYWLKSGIGFGRSIP